MTAPNHTISMIDRQALIAALPCFSQLTSLQCTSLATLFAEITYPPGETIVTEDATVDSFYIIVSGRAEVSKKNELLATLYPGEAIGLNDTGFFSATGTRTATVTSLTDIQLLKMDLQDFVEFLNHYPSFKTIMHASAEKMLRMLLIKKSVPFAQLSPARLEWLASQVETLHMPAGTVIFRQGEKGDLCYLIASGQVEILDESQKNAVKPLAILKSPALFGEATFITREPRNATAKAVEDCVLLALKNEHLIELVESENSVAKMFMHLMVDRSRPEKNTLVTEHPRVTGDGQEVVILKHPKGVYFKLSQEGWFIWQQFNGKRTMQEITLLLAEKYKVFVPDVVTALISKLAKVDFIRNLMLDGDLAKPSQPMWVKCLQQIQKILEVRVAFGNADQWITKIYHRFFHYLFTRFGQIALAVIAIVGILSFAMSTSSVIHVFKTVPNSFLIAALCLIPFSLLEAMLHELGHALTTKFFGHEVHYMGVGWYWFGPVAFTDTSDMWLSTRWPRLAVNVAGIYADIIIAGVCALLLWIIPTGYFSALLWMFALYAYLTAFRMSSPLQEWDGYYILMDLLDAPHLRQNSVIWLIKEFPKALRHPSLFLQYRKEVYYWLICILFLVVVCLVIMAVQSIIFHIIGHKPVNPLMNLIIPLLVVVVSSLSIVADIRSQKID